MMTVEIVFPQGMFGASDSDTLLDIALRRIAMACPHHESSWVEKYGANFENDVFLMSSFCWCEKEDCPWCMGCTCDRLFAEYFVEGKRVSYDEYYAWYYALPKLPYGKPEFDAAWEAQKKYIEEHSQVIFDETKKCPYCSGELHQDKGAEPGMGAPNFWYKPAGFKVWWYKYIGRGVETNGVTVDLNAMLQSCLVSLSQEKITGA